MTREKNELLVAHISAGGPHQRRHGDGGGSGMVSLISQTYTLSVAKIWRNSTQAFVPNPIENPFKCLCMSLSSKVYPNKSMELSGKAMGDEVIPEDTPAYIALNQAGKLCTDYRRKDIEDIFTGKDFKATSSKMKDIKTYIMYTLLIPPPFGVILYSCVVNQFFVPAGHVGFLMNERNEYLFAEPGMHNIKSMFIRQVGAPRPLRGHIEHGNRTIVIVEQGHLGYAVDNGQPVLLPPGIHVWRSESLRFQKTVPLSHHLIRLGPYTLITVDEGYAAVTQNNGKQMVLPGGHTHFLDHMNWKFEKVRYNLYYIDILGCFNNLYDVYSVHDDENSNG